MSISTLPFQFPIRAFTTGRHRSFPKANSTLLGSLAAVCAVVGPPGWGIGSPTCHLGGVGTDGWWPSLASTFGDKLSINPSLDIIPSVTISPILFIISGDME